MKYIYDTHKSIETLDYYVTGVELQRISEVLDKDMDSAAEFLDYASEWFDRFQGALIIELSKIDQ